MSGMFYSLAEAAEKLNKTEAEIKQIVRDGQLREFRDGPNLLFKVEEVEALLPDADIPGPSETDEPSEIDLELPEFQEEEISEEEPLEEESLPELDLEPEPELEPEPILDLEPEPEPKQEQESEQIPEMDFELEPELEPEPILELEPELQVEPKQEQESEQIPEMDFELEPEPEKESQTGSEILMEPEEILGDTAELEVSDMETTVTPAPDASGPQESEEVKDEDLDDILLSSGAEIPPVMDGDLTNADTALPGHGTSILGLTDNGEYDLTDDTMAETAITDGTKNFLADDSLDEIEEDVSLDSFGSGSGLLDLSLQADDTSLGGILDEIYTDESSEPAQMEEPGTGADMVAESESMAEPEMELTPQITPDVSLAMGAVAAQVPPDSQSNILGLVLFIPFFALIYAVIVTLSGMRGISPSILEPIQSFIWYIMGGLVFLAVIISAVAMLLTGEKKASVPKEKKAKKQKVKKEKAPKVKKEKVKKPKKEKPPKPKKEKKPKKKK